MSSILTLPSTLHQMFVEPHLRLSVAESASGGTSLAPNPARAGSFASYRFDNLPISDVLARTEHGLGTLELVIELLRRTAAAEESYSKGLLDTSKCCAPAALRGTGQGLSASVDSQEVATSFVGATASALGLGGLWGGGGSASASASSSSAHSSAHGSPVASPDGSISTALGNGPGSLHWALSALHTCQARQAAQRHAMAQHLLRLHANLTALRGAQRPVAAALSARVGEVAKGVSTASREVERAQARVERARREREDSSEALRSARAAGGAVDARELERRGRRAEAAREEVDRAEGAVMASYDSLSSMRRRGGEELAPLALRLQALEEERATALRSTLADLVGSALESASATRSAVGDLQEAVSSVCSESDTRTFLHHRRLARMIQEQTAMQDRRGGGGMGGGTPGGGGGGEGGSSSSAGEAFLSLPPNPLPASEAFRNSKDFLRDEAELGPLVGQWVEDIVAGRGGEALEGQALPAPPETREVYAAFMAAAAAAGGAGGAGGAGAGAADGRSSPTPGATAASAAAAAPPPTLPCEAVHPAYDIALLQRHAARLAFLRALNLLRSKRHEIGGAAFTRLARALWWLLDASLAQMDVASARMAMIISETFYYAGQEEGEEEGGEKEGQEEEVSGDGEAGEGSSSSPQRRASSPAPRKRLFLQRLLTAHPLWRMEGFWEEQFYTSVFDAVRTMSRPYTSSSASSSSSRGAASTPAGKKEGSEGSSSEGSMMSPSSVASPGPQSPVAASYRPGSTDWTYAYEQTIGSQLLAIAHNMSTFGEALHCLALQGRWRRLVSLTHAHLPTTQSLAPLSQGMPVDRTLRTIFTLARANGVREELLASLKMIIMA